MRTKDIRIGKKLHVIKQLMPIDFIERENLPFSLFVTDNGDTSVYSNIMAELDKNKKLLPKDISDRMGVVTSVLSVGVITPGINGSDLIVDNINAATRLYAEILKLSFPMFQKVYKIPRVSVIEIDKMAQRYGKTPAQIQFGNACNEIEALMFNTFIFSVGVQHDIDIQKKQIEEIKKRTNRR